MKLIHDLYKVLEIAANETGFAAVIELNAGHIIYQAHFPGYPVTPGVIQMQIVQELIELQLGKSVILIEMPQCKFLNKLNPEETPKIAVHFKISWFDDHLQVNADGEHEGIVFFKLTVNYRISIVL